MFGTLKPHTCRLGCDRARAYEAFYCGLCKSLGDHFGTLTRALLNYDAVFLALVADGLMEEAAEPDRCRCPMLPIVHRPTVRADSPAMRYAAAMQMLLADQWLADRAEDGKRTAIAARPLLSGKVEAARAILDELGISLADLDGFEREQAAREVLGVTGPREAAEPTASALGRVFARMAHIPGAREAARSDEAREALSAFGRHLGSAIYLIDALDDLPKDQRARAFNPCLVRGPRDAVLRVSWSRVELCWSLLSDDLAALDALVAALPLARHRDLVASVVAVELRRAARVAAVKAHAHARAEEQRIRAARRPWPVRALAAAATAFVLAWVWLASLPALARGPQPKRLPDAGAKDPGKAKVPPSWDPKLPPSASAPRPPASAPTSRGGGEEPTSPTKPAPSASPSPAPAPPGPGTSSPGGGGGCGCGNPCSGCGGGTGAGPCDCCKGCNDCGGCCKTCDGCSGCCNSCNGGCGSCCK